MKVEADDMMKMNWKREESEIVMHETAPLQDTFQLLQAHKDTHPQ